jgi:hypothetical protein
VLYAQSGDYAGVSEELRVINHNESADLLIGPSQKYAVVLAWPANLGRLQFHPQCLGGDSHHLEYGRCRWVVSKKKYASPSHRRHDFLQ